MAKTSKKPATRKRGRPTGSKTNLQVVDAAPSRCPKCESTRREPYNTTRRFDYAGNDPVLGTYTAVIFRATCCRDCGQRRVDRSFENNPAPQ